MGWGGLPNFPCSVATEYWVLVKMGQPASCFLFRLPTKRVALAMSPAVPVARPLCFPWPRLASFPRALLSLPPGSALGGGRPWMTEGSAATSVLIGWKSLSGELPSAYLVNYRVPIGLCLGIRHGEAPALGPTQHTAEAYDESPEAMRLFCRSADGQRCGSNPSFPAARPTSHVPRGKGQRAQG